jgi:hypothetical protein
MARRRGGGGAKSNQELREKLDPIVRARLDSISYATKLQVLEAKGIKISNYHIEIRQKNKELRGNKLSEYQKSIINEKFLELFPDAIIREL